MKQKRLKPAVRKDEVVTAALKLAAASHYLKVTREDIAGAVGVSGPAIQYHFGTMPRLRNEVMRAAVKRPVLAVLAQGLVAKDPQALKASEALRLQAFEWVARGAAT